MIYFDSASSYPVLPEVQAVLQDSYGELYGNSTATHKLGLSAYEEIEKAREKLAEKIGALSSEVIFTSGATESNNIAFKSILLDNPTLKAKKHIVTSQLEHKCILAICNYLEKYHNYTISYARPNKDGIVTVEEVAELIQDDTALVSIMHVNNELGTINPIGLIGKLCFEKGILFHSDAAQSFCKIDIDVDDLYVDLMSFSAHKIGGPKGIGAVYIRDLRQRSLSPVIHGAGQEDGVRGGTVAAPLISAFSKALSAFPTYYKTIKTRQLKQHLVEYLNQQEIEFKLNGEKSLCSIVSLSFANVDVNSLIRQSEEAIALAQGSACSSKQIEPSHVLSAIGLDNHLLHNTLRISFSHLNVFTDIEKLVESIAAVQI